VRLGKVSAVPWTFGTATSKHNGNCTCHQFRRRSENFQSWSLGAFQNFTLFCHETENIFPNTINLLACIMMTCLLRGRNWSEVLSIMKALKGSWGMAVDFFFNFAPDGGGWLTPFYPQEWYGTHSIGCWLGLTNRLDVGGKPRLRRDSGTGVSNTVEINFPSQSITNIISLSKALRT